MNSDIELQKVRHQTISNKIGQNNDSFITLSEVVDTINNLNLNEIISQEAAYKIFSKVDVNNIGKIKKNDFINYLEKANKEDISYKLYVELTKNFTTKCELIIVKLKSIKEKLKTRHNENNDLNDELNWIINTIANENIYEPEMLNINNIKKENKDLFGLISSVETSNLKSKDLELLNLSINTQKNRSFLKIKDTSIRNSVIEICKFGIENKLNEFLDNNTSIGINKINNDFEVGKKLYDLLSRIDDPNFNIFELNNVGNTPALILIANEIFSRKKYFASLLNEKTFNVFIKKILKGYTSTNAYHNDLHAADVLQTVFVMLSLGDLEEKMKLHELDVLSTLMASILHDFKHPGLNNFYQINSKSEIAVTYNDISVLENYHISESFKIINNKNYDIFENLSEVEYRVTRRRIIELILATDMEQHSKHLTQFKAKLDSLNISDGKNLEVLISSNNLTKNYETQQIILNIIIHSADISNPAKILPVYKNWVNLVFTEFFNQGDIEKSKDLPVSMLCDRKTTNIRKSQLGFINFIVRPTFDSLINLIPQIKIYKDNIESNLNYFEKMNDEENSNILLLPNIKVENSEIIFI